MFDSLVLHGVAGEILYGYHTAAAVRGWRITKHRPDNRHDGKWRLTATIVQLDKFQLRQRPLLFTARRSDRGQWCWPLLDASVQIGTTTLVAILGPPEQ